MSLPACPAPPDPPVWCSRVDAPVALRSLDQQRRIPIRRRHWKLLEETTGESVRMRETQRNGNDSNRNDTHYPVDAVFTHASLGHHHQVRLNAPFLQVLAAVSSVPRLHIKLSMQTLQGILGDVHSPTRHTWECYWQTQPAASLITQYLQTMLLFHCSKLQDKFINRF